MYSFCAMYSFRMSFCSVPEIFFQSAPCCSATTRYMAHSTLAGELMVIDTVVFSRSRCRKTKSPCLPANRWRRRTCRLRLHCWRGRSRSPSAWAGRKRRRDRLPPCCNQIFVALIGFFRRRKAGELTHGPQFAAIAGGVDTTRVRSLAGMAEILVRMLFPVRGKVGGRVESLDGNSGDGGEAGGAIGIAIRAGIRANRLLRGF